MFFLNQTPANPDTVDKVLAALKQAGSYIANMGEFAFKEYARLIYADGIATLSVMAFFVLLSIALIVLSARLYIKQRDYVKTTWEIDRRTCRFGELSRQERHEYYMQPSVRTMPGDDEVVTVSRSRVESRNSDARWVPCIVSSIVAFLVSIVTTVTVAEGASDAITKIIAPSGWAIRSIIQDASKVK